MYTQTQKHMLIHIPSVASRKVDDKLSKMLLLEADDSSCNKIKLISLQGL